MLVSKSVAVEKTRVTLGTLITALFCDLSAADKEPTIPKQGELRERELRHLVRKRKKPISDAIVDSVLSKQIDDLEPTLTRHGYTAKVLTELLGTRPGEIRSLFRQTLEPDRVRELKDKMLAAGLPV